MSKLRDKTLKKISENTEISVRHHEKGFVYPNHWHDYFEFEIVLDGEYEHTVNNEKRIARAGSAWIMSRLNFHSLLCTRDAKILNISFTGEGISRELIELISSSVEGFLCELDAETARRIADNARIAEIEMAEHPTLWQTNVKLLVEGILVDVIRSSPIIGEFSKERVPHFLQEVVSYIHNNYSGDLSLGTLAGIFNISAGHLGLVFCKTFGISISHYITRVRMKHACSLLENTALSTKEVAFMCGYNSIEYFHYSFKKHLQTTPAEYRKDTEKYKNSTLIIL